MTWIESHTDIWRHPRFVNLMDILDEPLRAMLGPVGANRDVRETVLVGCLHSLWHGTMDEQPDGDLTVLRPGAIAALARWVGPAQVFVDALCEIGLLERTDDGRLLVHDWDQYAAGYANLRAERRARGFAKAAAKREENGRFGTASRAPARTHEADRDDTASRAPARTHVAVENEPLPAPARTHEAVEITATGTLNRDPALTSRPDARTRTHEETSEADDFLPDGWGEQPDVEPPDEVDQERPPTVAPDHAVPEPGLTGRRARGRHPWTPNEMSSLRDDYRRKGLTPGCLDECEREAHKVAHAGIQWVMDTIFEKALRGQQLAHVSLASPLGPDIRDELAARRKARA